MMKTISEAWKDTKEVLKHKEGESSKLLYDFLMDLELGLNVPKGSTGARSPATLLRLSRCLTTVFNLISWKILEINQREMHELFKKMKDGEIKKSNGDNYKDVSEFIKNAKLYDPAAGSGTLLLALAHQIGEDKCSIFSQDISQKSNEFLRLNLILNKQVHSLHHIIKGDTLLKPYHKSEDKNDLARFDYVVSNPPFKTDFSDDRVTLDQDRRYPGRFFAGVPNVPKKDKEKMAIYLLFIQHILYSLSVKGKAAIVVPTGFLTAKGIGEKIREELVNRRILRGVVSMPSDIFATTGTNVSILFIDKENTNGEVVLMDASKLGTEVKEGKNQKTVLSSEEEQAIINTFNKQETKEDFTVVVSFDKIKQRNYSFSAGQYFDVKIEYIDITPKDFEDKISKFKEKLEDLFKESKDLEKEIKKQIENLKYE